MNDVELKNKGNKYFKARKYDDAVRCYSDAIAKKPGVSIYYTNRALCHLKCRRYDRVCQDCRAALEIDPMLVKAHFFLGQALLESQCYDESIRHFQRAQDLAKEQKVNYGDDIASLIRVARKRRFNLAEEARVSQEIELQSYLNRLILEDRDRQLAATRRHGGTTANLSSTTKTTTTSHLPLSHNNPPSPLQLQRQHSPIQPSTPECDDKENRQPCIESQGEGEPPEVIEEQAVRESKTLPEGSHPLSNDGPQPSSAPPTADVALTPEQINKRTEEYLLELNHMFAKLDERRRKREVPDYLCGKISFDILREPVVTPSGITYDKKDIEEHLQRVGHFDPITRTGLTSDLLVPNLAMKEVVDAFLEENEWALDY